ncbi:MAG: aldehyde dehydrogenase family protein [Myxococcales bacterium]|nr:aldehyde dehydrogenase family protein [Myxococcales bacterium]
MTEIAITQGDSTQELAYRSGYAGASEEPGGVSSAAGPDLAHIGRSVAELRKSFDAGATRSLEWREHELDQLARMLRENRKEIAQAVHEDVGKPLAEAAMSDVAGARGAATELRKKLRKWTAPKRVKTPIFARPGKSMILTEPLGVVLVIAPWNFPVDLALNPVAGAIAAGNAVVLKPSEVSARTSELLARLIPKYMDADCVRVIEGGVAETTELLAQRFDHIFYTGNGTIGRVVMQAAAKHLTPVTLELGGKSPCIIDASCNLEVSARRILWGKFFNCGQVCIAPDYVLAQADIYEALLEQLKATIVEFFGDDPQQSVDYGRIINARHHQRLMRLLASGGTVFWGGQADEADRYIAPTLLTDVPGDAAIMQEEIFGPLLPVVKVADVDEAIAYVNARPKPLALYYFGSDRENRDAIMARTSSGAVAVNQTVMHFASSELPFGGVGESGMGAYHGRHSIDTFSHKKPVLMRPTFFDPKFIYPPTTPRKAKLMSRVG